MEYAYAALLLTEAGEELNERTLRAVLESANCDVSESRVKALVAALEGVDVDSVAPDDGGQFEDEAASDPSGDLDTTEGGDWQQATEVTDETPGEATTDPAGDERTSGDIADESG